MTTRPQRVKLPNGPGFYWVYTKVRHHLDPPHVVEVVETLDYTFPDDPGPWVLVPGHSYDENNPPPRPSGFEFIAEVPAPKGYDPIWPEDGIDYPVMGEGVWPPEPPEEEDVLEADDGEEADHPPKRKKPASKKKATAPKERTLPNAQRPTRKSGGKMADGTPVMYDVCDVCGDEVVKFGSKGWRHQDSEIIGPKGHRPTFKPQPRPKGSPQLERALDFLLRDDKKPKKKGE